MAERIKDINITFYPIIIKYLEEEGILPEIYLDSKTLMGIVSGISNFQKGVGVDEKKINKRVKDDVLLVHALLYNSKVDVDNKFRILIPHQHEFRNFINRNSKNILTDKQINNLINTYYKRKEIEQKVKESRTIDEYIKNLGSTVSIFYIINFLTEEANWKARLKLITDKLHFDKNTDSPDFSDLIQGDLFNNIREGFNKERPHSTRNNTIDTLALCLLHWKLNKSNKNRLKYRKIPFFFDESGIFKKIIHQTGRAKDFKFNANIGKEDFSFSIIQDAKFFKLYYILKNNILSISESNKHDFSALYHNLHSKILTQLSTYAKEDTKVEKKAIEILDNASNLLDIGLLAKFWKEGKSNLIEQIIKTRFLERSDLIQEKLDDYVREIIEKLSKNVQELTTITRPYLALEDAFERLSPIIKEKLNNSKDNIDNINIHNRFGLARFCIAEENLKIIDNLLRRLLKSLVNNGQISNILTKAISYLREGIDSVQNRNKMIIGLTFLWIAEEYYMINQIFEHIKNEYQNDKSLICIHGASIAKEIKSLNENWKDKLNIIFNQLDEHDKKSCKLEPLSYQTDLIKSYINFQTWECFLKSESFFTRLKEPLIIPNDNNQIRNLLIKAISRIEKTIDWFQEEDNKGNKNYLLSKKNKFFYLYIINNYIFYVTMGYSDTKFDGLENKDLPGILANEIDSDKSLWQHIYDDTLALYNLRGARKMQDDMIINRNNKGNLDKNAIIEALAGKSLLKDEVHAILEQYDSSKEINKNKHIIEDFLEKADFRIKKAINASLRTEESKKYESLKEKIDAIKSGKFDIIPYKRVFNNP